MHIDKNCLHYPSLKKLDFLKNINIYNFIFISMVKKKTMEQWFQFLNLYNEF